MKTTKLNLNEIYQLSFELNGNETNKGLLQQPLAIKTKYWLQRLSDKIKSEVSTIDAVRNSLITELGVENNGKYEIVPKIADEENPSKMIDNPNFIEFQKKFSELLTEERDIEHAIFKLEQFEGLSAPEHYAVFLKLIDEEL